VLSLEEAVALLRTLIGARVDTDPAAAAELANFADYRIGRKQVLGGLTHEYYVAA
jgi:hypothetical protein